jgi:hypothetical protein
MAYVPLEHNSLSKACRPGYEYEFIAEMYDVATLYRRSDLRSPLIEAAWPGSQFLHSCICEQFI